MVTQLAAPMPADSAATCFWGSPPVQMAGQDRFICPPETDAVITTDDAAATAATVTDPLTAMLLVESVKPGATIVKVAKSRDLRAVEDAKHISLRDAGAEVDEFQGSVGNVNGSADLDDRVRLRRRQRLVRVNQNGSPTHVRVAGHRQRIGDMDPARTQDAAENVHLANIGNRHGAVLMVVAPV